MSSQFKKVLKLALGSVLFFGVGIAAYAAGPSQGIAGVATQVTSNLGAIAKLITGGAYVAGFGFVVGAIVKFKAHKDNPTQIAISIPIALLFVGAALIFVPSVFSTTGATLFKSGQQATVGGKSSF